MKMMVGRLFLSIILQIFVTFNYAEVIGNENYLKILLFLVASKEALKSGLSDMDYMRSKVAQTMEESDEADKEEEHGPVQHGDSAYESGERENVSKSKPFSGKKKQSVKQEVCFGKTAP